MDRLAKIFGMTPASESHVSDGKRAVTAKIGLPNGKRMLVVREDIFQRALTKRPSKEAA